jgi:hypothetical protein
VSHRPQREGRFEAGGGKPGFGHRVIGACCACRTSRSAAAAAGPEGEPQSDATIRARVPAIPPGSVATAMPRRWWKEAIAAVANARSTTWSTRHERKKARTCSTLALLPNDDDASSASNSASSSPVSCHCTSTT